MSKAERIYRPTSPDRSLSQCIQKIREAIAWIVEEYAKVSYDTFLAAAKTALRHDQAYAMDRLSEEFPAVDEDELRRLRVADACILLIAAEEAFQAGEFESAWYRCTVAEHQLGLYEGMFRDPFSSAERSDFATMGGYAKAKRTDVVRDELARLITQLRPAGGWEGIPQIAIAVEKPLYAFSQKSGGHLLEPSFRQNIRRWLRKREYKALQEALKRNMKRGVKPH